MKSLTQLFSIKKVDEAPKNDKSFIDIDFDDI